MKGNKSIRIDRMTEREFGLNGIRNPVRIKETRVHIATWWSGNKKYDLGLRNWAIFKK